MKNTKGLTWLFIVFFVGSSVLSPTELFANHRSWDGEGSYWEVGEEDEIRTWRRYSSETQQAIDALPEGAVQDLPIPILLGVSVSDLTQNFGDARDGGARVHEGLDMMAPKGTPVASPTDAVVIRTGEGSSSGINVYTVNPGDEIFVYMHLDEIAEGISSGTVLKKGQILGYVGNTGNASGGPDHLHFEIRKNGASDPYPRLTAVFSLEEQVKALSDVFALHPRKEEFATFLATAYGRELTEATEKGLVLPASLANALLTRLTQTPSISVVSDELPSGDLTIDSTGSAVSALQLFLIGEHVGSAGERLARAGATGYFGPITEAALREYQAAVGISPASGYYGPITRAFIENRTSVVASVPQEESGSSADKTVFSFTRDLTIGSRGEDVRALQEFLNAQNFLVAEAGAGSPGNETTYFGALTQTALASYQAAQGITPSIGYFGPITRSSIL